MPAIRILIVDDHPVFRQGLHDLLELNANIEVVGEAPTGELAFEQAAELQPDIVLMDINLPQASGTEITARIKARMPHIKIIILTGYDDVRKQYAALRAGAAAYCVKDIRPDLLFETVTAVAAGRYVLNGRVVSAEEIQARIDRYSKRPSQSARGGGKGPLLR